MNEKALHNACVFLTVALLLAGCSGQSSSPTAVTPEAEATGKQLPVVSAPPEVVAVEADHLIKEYLANEHGTLTRYDHKLLDVSGTVLFANSDNLGELPQVALHDPNDKSLGPLDVVTCLFSPQDEERVVRLVEGQKVKIRGKLGGFTLGVPLVECQLIDAGAEIALRVSAEELTREAARDFAEAKKKYDDKRLLLTGVVQAVQFDPDGNGTCTLEGCNEKESAPLRVQVRLNRPVSKAITEKLKDLKKGQTVTFKGLASFTQTGGKPTLILLRGYRLN